MEDGLLRLIYDYSINGKLADNNFIDKLVEIVVLGKGLNDYLRGDITFLEVPGDSVAAYDVLTRKMIINKAKLQARLENFENMATKFGCDERMFFRNAVVSHVVLHEIEHIAQNEKYNSEDTDTETLLCKLGLRDNYLYGDVFTAYDRLRSLGMSDAEIYKLYNDRCELRDIYYLYSPTERMAEISSHSVLNELFSQIHDKAPNVQQYEQFQTLTKMYSGYADVDGLGGSSSYINIRRRNGLF